MSTSVLDVSWHARAACRGPGGSLFYPPMHAESRSARDARERRAKAVCGACPVRTECLAHALRIRDQHGIWGGLNEHERRALLDA